MPKIFKTDPFATPDREGKGKPTYMSINARPCGFSALPLPCRRATNGGMDDTPITTRKYTNFDDIKADEYRYWQSRPVHERMDAIEELIQTAYALKGWEIEPDVPRLQRPFVRLPVPWR
jgi:hypothetical protein